MGWQVGSHATICEPVAMGDGQVWDAVDVPKFFCFHVIANIVYFLILTCVSFAKVLFLAVCYNICVQNVLFNIVFLYFCAEIDIKM